MNLDLGVYYPIKIGEKRELRLSGDWFNVFNSQRAITLDQTFSINSGVTGVPAVANPFYGSAQIVQAPSAFRFGRSSPSKRCRCCRRLEPNPTGESARE